VQRHFRGHGGTDPEAADQATGLATGPGRLGARVAEVRVNVLCFQPLARIDEAGERAWAAEWLETVFALQGVTITPPLRARIERALELVDVAT